MLKTKNRNLSAEKGFTIIEVLIVLAIAGLILLIVFLAVPNLQRNSRNTQAKNAASGVLGAINEFQNNNNGAMPSGATPITIANDGTVTVSGTGATPATAKIQGGYTVSSSTTFPAVTGGTAGNFQIALGQKCNGNAFTASPRAVAIVYYIETSSSATAVQCIDS